MSDLVAVPVLPPLLKDNPRLDQWVRFERLGRVTVSTGRVEIGQGVLTAMMQIAADELDVSLDRIDLRTGDTTLTPNEGYTAGSQSIQFGGIAMRLACAAPRLIFRSRTARSSVRVIAEFRPTKRPTLCQMVMNPERGWPTQCSLPRSTKAGNTKSQG